MLNSALAKRLTLGRVPGRFQRKPKCSSRMHERSTSSKRNTRLMVQTFNGYRETAQPLERGAVLDRLICMISEPLLLSRLMTSTAWQPMCNRRRSRARFSMD
jgi:hypothetical protein